MKLLMVGCGYVGLVTGTCFAEMGHDVYCLDNDAEKLDLLLSGKLPFYEMGLEELFKRNMQANRLHFVKTLVDAPVIFLCLPTPSSDDGSADLSYVFDVAKTIGQSITKHTTIVTKSTVPVGTAKEVHTIIQAELDKRNSDVTFSVVSNPEFLKEGSAVNDCMKPDRIVIGCDNKKDSDLMRSLYAPFSLNHDRVMVMDIPSAELTKYAANCMLASRISFMNEISHICEKTGANINTVRLGIGSDKRIGFDFLYAGTGFGGSCFPKDVRALKHLAQNLGLETDLLSAILTVNQKQKRILLEKLLEHFNNNLNGKTVAIWGLSFKPGTDDIRESPALTVIAELLNRNVSLNLFDPVAMDVAKKHLPSHPKIKFCESEYDAVTGADAICLMTEWKQFRFADMKKVHSLMTNTVFFDGRNQYAPDDMLTLGFDYYGIGLPSRELATR